MRNLSINSKTNIIVIDRTEECQPKLDTVAINEYFIVRFIKCYCCVCVVKQSYFFKIPNFKKFLHNISSTFCTQHRLLKRKLKLCKRVSTLFGITPSSNLWGYRPTCLARRQNAFSTLRSRYAQQLTQRHAGR